MASTVGARLERIEPRARASWRRAWDRYAASVALAVPDDVLGHALRAPDDEAAWIDFQAAHGLREIVAWHDQHDPFPLDPDAPPDLTVWPASIPLPPREPRGTWDRMQELRKGDGDAAAYASAAVLVLGLAWCVREAKA